MNVPPSQDCDGSNSDTAIPSAGDFFQRQGRRAVTPLFETTDVALTQPRLFGEFLLRQSGLLPKMPYPFTHKTHPTLKPFARLVARIHRLDMTFLLPQDFAHAASDRISLFFRLRCFERLDQCKQVIAIFLRKRANPIDQHGDCQCNGIVQHFFRHHSIHNHPSAAILS